MWKIKNELKVIHDKQSKVKGDAPCDRVHFTVPLANVELASQLPVLQFCAKVSGRLPMRVRWFRSRPGGEDSEIELNNPHHLPKHARASSLRCMGAAAKAAPAGD